MAHNLGEKNTSTRLRSRHFIARLYTGTLMLSLQPSNPKRSRLLTALCFFCGVAVGPAPADGASTRESAGQLAAGAGAVSGRVTNLATGSFLEGAKVQVDGTDRV